MFFYTDLFSPETYDAFSKSDRTISGFRKNQASEANKVKHGDILICYMTKFSRWIGALEIQDGPHIDDTPIFFDEDDPFVVRFKVKEMCWLKRDITIPIHEDIIWNNLSFTKELDKGSKGWTGMARRSLRQLNQEDGEFLQKRLEAQIVEEKQYPIDDKEFRKYFTHRIKRPEGAISVFVPKQEDEEEAVAEPVIRESIKVQALIANIGAKMGYKVWIPRNDFSRVKQMYTEDESLLIEKLPFTYEDATQKTIEQIDVLWLKRRSIIRAFEVEHKTSIYSGLLRMADLMALQPNITIRIHIVAPFERREKVLEEIQRPVFSLLEKGPLAEFCTFISYDSINEIARLKHLPHLEDSILEDYSEDAV